jgi:hypothetical protein
MMLTSCNYWRSNRTLLVGDILIAKTPEARRPFRGGPVLEIQVDHVSVPEVNGGPGVQIGLLVGFGAKINQEFYCVSR